jgi:hypothetical protein
MATTFPRVKPGDVIDATQWNNVLSAVEYLYGQLSTVTTSNVVISGFMPPNSVTVGDQLSILGQNFQYSIGATSVYFENVQISSFLPGSSDTQLYLTVPNVPNLPPAGRPVTITVYNRTSNAQQSITVVPEPLPLSGFVDVVPGTTGVAQAGVPANYQFTLNSRVNQTAAFTISGVTDQQGWTIQTLASDMSVLNNGQLNLVPYQPQQVYIQLTAPPGVASGVVFNLTVNVSVGNSVFGTTGPIQHTTGQADVQPDTSITIGQASGNPPANLQNGSTISAAVGTLVVITVPTTFTFTPAAAYTVTLAPVGTLANWTVNLQYPSGTPGTSSSGTFTPPVGNVQNLVFAVQPGAGASASGLMQLSIQRQGATTQAVKNFPVSLSQ